MHNTKEAISAQLIDQNFNINDIAEFGIDQFMNNGILKEFPLTSALTGIYNVYKSL